MPTSSKTLTVAKHNTPLTHCFRANAIVLKYSDPLTCLALIIAHPDFLDVLAWSLEVNSVYSENKEQGLFLYYRNREIILIYYLQIIKALTGVDLSISSSPEYLEKTYNALMIHNRKLFNNIHETLKKQPSGNFHLFFNAILQGDYLQAQQLLYTTKISPPNQIWKLALFNPNHITKSTTTFIAIPDTTYEALFHRFSPIRWVDDNFSSNQTRRDLNLSCIEIAGLELNYLFSKRLMHTLFEPQRSESIVFLGFYFMLVMALILFNVWAFYYFTSITHSVYMLAGLAVCLVGFIREVVPLLDNYFWILFIPLTYLLLTSNAFFNFILSSLTVIGLLVVTLPAMDILTSLAVSITNLFKNSILYSIVLYSTVLITLPLLLIPRLVTNIIIPITYILMSTIYLPIKFAYTFLGFCLQNDNQLHFNTHLRNAYNEYQQNLHDIVSIFSHVDKNISCFMHLLIEGINNPFPFFYQLHRKLLDNPQLLGMMNNARLVYASNPTNAHTLTPKMHLVCLLKHYLQPGIFASFFKTIKPHAKLVQALLIELETDNNFTMSYADFRFSTEKLLNSDLIGIGEYIRYVLVPMEQKNHYEASPSPENLQAFLPALH